MKEGELYFVKADTSKPDKEQLEEVQEKKKKPRWGLIVLCAILVIATVIAAYGSYNLGNSTGYKTGSDFGYDNGYLNGNSSGYQFGYDIGYLQGNLSSYQLGYDSGFLQGNFSGFRTGFSFGNETGYDASYIKGVVDGAGRGYNIRDPTYQEAINFVVSDKTDQHEYSENYMCWNFAADFTNNAFKAGYRCGWVYIKFPTGAHAIVCFNTTDHGIVFIEPQDDYIASLTIGQHYWDRTKYLPPSYDDTVVSLVIIW